MIGVVIPTLDTQQGETLARVAKATAGCEARFVVVSDWKREGFTRTTNRGMRSVGPIETCLLNDDIVTFRQGWLADLHSRLVADIGIVGPGSGRGYWFRTPESWPQYTYSAEHLSFWCVLIRQEVRQAAGLLDESYIHYSSDYAYCDLVRELGWDVALCSDLGLMHRMGGSNAPTGWMGHDLGLYKFRRERDVSVRHTHYAPYFPQEDMEAFESLVKSLKPKRVLEWGAGRSTVYWPPRIPNLECWVSIEHNFIYWNRFRTQVAESVDLRFRAGDDYLLPEEGPVYDLVIVDGDRRDECLLRAHGLVKPGGAVVLHDWGRRYCKEGIATYAKQEILTQGNRLERNGDVTQGLLLLGDAQTESGLRP